MIGWNYSKNVYVAYFLKNNEYRVYYPNWDNFGLGIHILEDYLGKKYLMAYGKEKINDSCYQTWTYYNKSVMKDLYLCVLGKPCVNLAYIFENERVPDRIMAKIKNIELIDMLDKLG
jgi:hypothetical protein